jgi:outer membrane biogenesis lipoprotein LolB
MKRCPRRLALVGVACLLITGCSSPAQRSRNSLATDGKPASAQVGPKAGSQAAASNPNTIPNAKDVGL